MEVCEGTIASYKSDMGFPDPDEVFAVRGFGGNSLITMEGSEHVGVGNAEVRSFPLILNRYSMPGLQC